MSALGSERLLTMSAFEAAFLLRRYRSQNPTYTNDQLIESIRTVRADFYPNDYQAGLLLESGIATDIEFSSDDHFYRHSIETIIMTQTPLWTRLAPGGRDHVMRAVSINGIQCFRNAGLLQSPPSKEVSDWWDALACRIRSDRDAWLLEQGREAERKSFEFECERVKSLGITLEPKWVSIDDNSAGYDILSYDPGDPGPMNKLIEVKSSSQDPPNFVVTRGEWDAALEYGETYFFHLWDMKTNEMVEISPRQLSSHMPSDHGIGHWLKAEFSLPELIVPV